MHNIAGIDIASRKFNYRIINGNGASLSKGSCEMSHEGFKSFLSDVPEDTVFIMESTGHYHKNLCHFLIGKDFHVCVENPMMIKNCVKSTTLRKTKTDRADALSIARYGLPITIDSVCRSTLWMMRRGTPQEEGRKSLRI